MYVKEAIGWLDESRDMQWLVNIDRAVSDGTISVDAGAKLKRLAREAMVDYAINLVLFAGIVMVVSGAWVWLADWRALTALGIALAIVGTFTLLRGGRRLRLVANATAIIGITLAMGALAVRLFAEWTDPLGVGAALGLPAVALGWLMRRLAPMALSVLGGWILLLGVGVHVAGVLTTESAQGLEWLALHYTGVLTIICGIMLDVRFVTAISIVPLASSLSSQTFYGHASYGLAVYEVTLTILQMSLFAIVALTTSLHFTDRIARHARLLGQLALIWMNVAFWIGSLWGDVVGSHLWFPRRETVTSGLDSIPLQSEAWRAAVEAFEAQALVIPANAFAAVWAIGILAFGAWGAWTARRAVLNISVTFGAIHFYTQYFERLEATPGTFMIAGVIAILAAWALWMFNRRLAQR